jgi:hypothetical protein
MPSSRTVSGRRRAGGPPRPSRTRDRPSERAAISMTAMRLHKSAIRSALVVTIVLSLATGAYFAFSDGVLSRLIDQETKIKIPHKDHVAELRAQVDRMSGQFLDNKQAEQQLAALLGAQVDRIGQLERNISTLSDLFRSDTIKPERITPPNTVNFIALSDHETLSQSRELPAKARVKQHRVHRVAHQRALRRHRIAAAAHTARPASAVEMRPQSSQLTSATTKALGIADQ